MRKTTLVGIVFIIQYLLLVFGFTFSSEFKLISLIVKTDENQMQEYLFEKNKLSTEEMFKISFKMQIILNEYNEELEKMELIYNEELEAKVCSKVNSCYNRLKESYERLQDISKEFEVLMQTYNEEYRVYQNLLVFKNDKNQYCYQIMCLKDMSRKIDEFLDKQNKAINMHSEAQQRADEIFEEYFSLMARIVNAEAGSCSAFEQYLVMNVIENRIESHKYPNTLYGVIYDTGQYAPVENGSINKKPSASVLQNVETYLRGNVQTEMPGNVLYQAQFKQGDYVWMHTEYGHFYCGEY